MSRTSRCVHKQPQWDGKRLNVGTMLRKRTRPLMPVVRRHPHRDRREVTTAGGFGDPTLAGRPRATSGEPTEPVSNETRGNDAGTFPGDQSGDWDTDASGIIDGDVKTWSRLRRSGWRSMAVLLLCCFCVSLDASVPNSPLLDRRGRRSPVCHAASSLHPTLVWYDQAGRVCRTGSAT